MRLLFYILLGIILTQAKDERTDTDPCGPDLFSCVVERGSDPRCVPNRWKCDGTIDCYDRTDEPDDCRKVHKCSKDEFECASGRCLPRGYVCDRQIDCGHLPDGRIDDSDETIELCHTTQLCPPNEYACSSKCVPLSKFCDQKVDCEDGSDEQPICAMPEAVDPSHNCTYGARLTAQGVVCFCPTNQIVVTKDGMNRCEPENQCLRPMKGLAPVCSQRCSNNSDGSFICSCEDGFTLVNATSCVAEPSDITIVLQSTEKNMWLTLNQGKEQATKYSNRHDVMAWAVHGYTRRELCYLSETGSDSPFIACNQLNDLGNSEHRIKYNSSAYPLTNVNKMVYDEYGSNWIFAADAHLFMCYHSLQRGCLTLMDGSEFGKIEDMVMDSAAGYLFYSDSGSKTVGVYRMSLHDKKKVQMTTKAMVMPSALAIDPITQTLYLADKYLQTIKSVDYKKENPPRTIIQGQVIKSISKMIFVDGKLIFTSTKKIGAVSVTSGAFQEDLVKSSMDNQFDEIGLFSNTTYGYKKYIENPCKKANCPYMCVINANNTLEAVCVCPEGTTLEGSACVVGGPKDDLLIYARSKPAKILGVSLPTEKNKQKTTPSMVPILDAVRPSGFVVDSVNDEILYSDLNRGAILRRKLHVQFDPKIQPPADVIADEDLRNVEGLALDPSTDNLYFADQGVPCIGVMRRSVKNSQRVLIRGNLKNPRALAVDVPKGYLFWSDWVEEPSTSASAVARTSWQRGGAKIERAKMDGSDRKMLVSSRVHWPNGLAVDSSDSWLYWTDAYYDVIERVHFNGADREIIANSAHVSKPFAITLFGNILFWCQNGDGPSGGLVKRIDVGSDVLQSKRNNTIATVIEGGSPTFALGIYDSKAVKVTSACSKDNGGCAHLCFAMACKGSVGCEPAKCACFDGFITDKDDPKNCKADPSFSPHTCSPQQFRCVKSGHCISKDLTCDGDDDCPDASDEDTATTCKDFKCAADHMRCDGNSCVPNKWLCDGRKDCEDGTDEDSAHCKDTPVKCSADQIQCNSTKECIPSDWKCDGTMDCTDGEDERDCPGSFCSSVEFRCANGKCLPMTSVCNGVEDCRDGSDEKYCKQGCVSGHQFRCAADQPCMDLVFQCDGVDDCPGGTDEDPAICGNVSSSSSSSLCPRSNQFLCAGSGRCIRKAFVCDGAADCPNAEDEINCSPIACPSSSHFACPDMAARCISKELLCDGVNDCEDGADEKHCVETRGTREKCLAPKYQCVDSEICLPKDSVCDGKSDCPNSDDETSFCHQNKCSLNRCHQLCHPSPVEPGFVCDCREGYSLSHDEITCTKNDPCSFGSCSQKCEPAGSRRHCYCETGFELRPDRFTCRAVDPRRAFILYSNRHEINLLPADNPRALPLVTGLKNVIAVDYLYHINGSVSIYWTDITSDTIHRALLTGKTLSPPELLVSSGVWTAEGLAVDWVTGNVYWVDSSLDQIEMCTSDGSLRTIVLSGNMTHPRAIAVDPSHGLMFWTDWDEGYPRIERANMAGGDRMVIFNVSGVVNGGWPNGLTCDTLAQRIYWVDAKSDSIHTVLYDGSGHVEVLRDNTHLAHPFSIDLFENHVYWTDWRILAVVRANKWNGTQMSVVKSTQLQPFYIKVVHRSKQPRTKNPCDGAPCEYVCLIKTPTSYECRCPPMMSIVQGQTQKCADVRGIIMVATNRRVLLMKYNGTQSVPVMERTFQSIDTAIALHTAIIVVSSSPYKMTQIDRFDLLGKGEHKPLFSGELSNPSMTADLIADIIYLSDYTPTSGFIAAYDETFKWRKTILDSKTNKYLKKPAQIAFNHRSSKLVWLDVGYTPSKMFACMADGSFIMELQVDSALLTGNLSRITDRADHVQWFQRTTTGSIKNVTVDMRTHVGTSSEMSTFYPHFLPIREGIIAPVNQTTPDQKAKMTEGKVIAEWPVKLDADSYIVAMGEIRSNRNTAVKCPLPDCDGLCIRIGDEHRTCVCADGETMERGKCIGPPTVVYVVNDRRLEMFGVSSNGSIVQPGGRIPSNQPRSAVLEVAADGSRNRVFIISSSNELLMSDREGTPFIEILKWKAMKITTMAVDEYTGYIYVGGRHEATAAVKGGFIYVVDPSIEGIQQALVHDHQQIPYSIAVDAKNGLLFWAGSGYVKTCDLLGKNTKILIDKWVGSISIDPIESQLCYTTANSSSVQCTAYLPKAKSLGKVASFARQGLQATVPFTFNGDSMLLFDVYDLPGPSLRFWNRRADKTFAKRIEDRTYSGEVGRRLKALSVALFQADSKPPSSPCSIDSCEHICVPLKDSFKCLCAHGEVTKNGSCIAYNAFVIAGTPTAIEFASLPSSLDSSDGIPLSTLNTPFKTIQEKTMAKTISVIEADPDRMRVYLVDPSTERILTCTYDQSVWFVVAEDVGIVTALSFDVVHRELYYTRVSPASIWRISLNDDNMENYPRVPQLILLLDIEDQPTGIAVHPCRMLIFIANSGRSPAIERMYYSGFKREVIVDLGVSKPLSIAIDTTAEKIYFAETMNNQIRRVDFDGTFDQIVLTGQLSPPFGVAVYKDMLVYSSPFKSSITVTDKINPGPSNTRNIRLPIKDILPIAISASDYEQCGADPCTSSKLDCSDVCRLTAAGVPHCVCNGDRVLLPDNKTCIGVSELGGKCGINEFECRHSGRCLPYEETCDRAKDCPLGEDEDIDYCANRDCRPGYFSCGSGLCVPEASRCNGANDCGNYADELDCPCKETQFRCDSGMCVSLTQRCDFHRNCNDATDEIGCPPRDCSTLDDFGFGSLTQCARTTQCIAPFWLCDGTNDCWDGSDEENCTVIVVHTPPAVFLPRSCSDSEFRCHITGVCISKGWRCDGQRDCADESDEEDCEHKCDERYEFLCHREANRTCIDMERRCNGVEDCPMGEDEIDCRQGDCGVDSNATFRCSNHRCIPWEWRCDGTDDCLDGGHDVGSDEKDCGGDQGTLLATRSFCGKGEFQCLSSEGREPECVPRHVLCDTVNDCDDGSDEHVDSSDPDNLVCKVGNHKCVLGEFKCDSGQCIPMSAKCNGFPDCVDGSDEDKPGTKRKCRDQPNTYVDACTNSNCSHLCHIEAAAGFGYIPKKSSRCLCALGYQSSQEDLNSCKRKIGSEEPEILLISRHKVSILTIDGRPKATLLNNLTNGVAVDYDIRSSLVYFTDPSNPDSSRKMGMISLSGQPNTFRFLSGLGAQMPDGIAIDWLSRNIYWCDKDDQSIMMSNMKGRYRRLVLRGDPLENPRAIVIDSDARFIFWSDWGAGAHIGRMGLGGENVKVLLRNSVRWPNALAVDSPARRIYWGDAHFDHIASADYEGFSIRVVIRSSVRKIFSLSVFEDTIYWTDWHNRSVERAHKISGADRKTIHIDSQYRPMGIKIVHPLQQFYASAEAAAHPCSQPARCDNLCISTGAINNATYKCLCAEGFRSQGRSCVPACKPQDMVCSGTYKCIPKWWKCDGQDDCGDGEDELYHVKGACPAFPCEPGQMVCSSSKTANTTCINTNQICDGRPDCTNGEDEETAFCTSFECNKHQFKCDRKCIPLTSFCDGSEDCLDGMDESSCGKANITCAPDHFACVDSNTGFVKQCIQKSFYCDGEADCHDGQDEPENCPHLPCSKDSFRCDSGKCLHLDRRCDGINDCRDKSDEKDCDSSSGHCVPGDSFHCVNSSACISLAWRCDGVNDCDGGSDEEGCPEPEVAVMPFCAPDEMHCGLGHCILTSQRCDGILDCVDGIDENNCQACPLGSLRCPDSSICLKPSQFCDGITDCPSGSDETHCVISVSSEVDIARFPCFPNSTHRRFLGEMVHSVPWDSLCDGIRDCANGNDEMTEMCKLHHCAPGLHRCSSGHCYSPSGHCDGTADCPDGSDEMDCPVHHANYFRCHSGRYIPQELLCDGNDDCMDNTDEERCGVSEECGHFGSCSQLCGVWKPTVYSKKAEIGCYCADGYQKSGHGFQGPCRAIDGNPTLLVLDGMYLREFSIENHTIVPTSLRKFTDVHEPIIDIAQRWTGNPIKRELIIAEAGVETMSILLFDTEKSTISKGNLSKIDRTKRSTYALPADDLNDFSVSNEDKQSVHIAYEWGTQNVYYSQPDEIHPQLHRIFVISPTDFYKSPSNRRTYSRLVVDERSDVTSIAVDLEKGLLIWTTRYPRPAIVHSALNGSNIEYVITENIHYPRSLCVDIPNSRMYWADFTKGTIETANMDGSDRRIVRKYSRTAGPDRAWSIDVFENALFAVLRPSGTIWRIHKFGREEHILPYNLTGSSRMKLVVSHKVRQMGLGAAARLSIEKKAECAKSRVPCLSDLPKFPTKEIISTVNFTCACDLGEWMVDGECVLDTRIVTGVQRCGLMHCVHGGKCVMTSYPRCVCPGQYSGQQCENDDCRGMCLNGGRCQPVDSTYRATQTRREIACSCKPGFIGARCEISVCSTLCGVHGSCSANWNGQGRPDCICEPGWAGATCDKKTDPCDDFCFNDGICTATADGPYCKCPQYYEGARCENCQLPSGSPLICLNQGRCVDRNRCQCNGSYTGVHCETDVCQNKCPYGSKCLADQSSATSSSSLSASSSSASYRCQCRGQAGALTHDCKPICDKTVGWCANGGQCVDLPDEPGHCECPPRFMGAHCELERPCQQYCMNEASCTIKGDTHYECRCVEPFFGARCTESAACFAHNCLNGAECLAKNWKDEDGSTVYTSCQCTKGFTGQWCQSMNATICDDLDCLNSGFCITTSEGPKCVCRPDWQGINCATPRCEDGACKNGGHCLQNYRNAIRCRCAAGFFGPRCQYIRDERHDEFPELRARTSFTPMIVALVLTIVIMGAIVKRNSIKTFVSNLPVRFRPNDVPLLMDSFHENPVFDGPSDAPTTAQPLLVDESIITFENPAFESDSGGIYNDTVTSSHESVELIPRGGSSRNLGPL